jgi:farnesyl-diphosphate farnesyltransferase
VKLKEKIVKSAVKSKNQNLDFCYEKLQKTSRSFAAVIMQLGEELRDAVCIFYLVLRGLDTIEDDMSIPMEIKNVHLLNFYLMLDNPEWHFDDAGEGEEKALLVGFYHVCRAFLALPVKLQGPIKDIARDMGAGMADYQRRSTEFNVDTVAQYEMYCHYVAGLVGFGLTRLFVNSGLEKPALLWNDDDEKLDIFNLPQAASSSSTSSSDDDRQSVCGKVLANSMGLFLQKVNIIRDYLEDITQEPAPRIFWPKEIWKNYTSDIRNFKLPENRKSAVQCLNAMITDALKHIPDCLAYMSRLSDPKVFTFCAIPQTMAIATLAALYNNGAVFEKNVKIPKGMACRLIINSTCMAEVQRHFRAFLLGMRTVVKQVQQQDDHDQPQTLLLLSRIDASLALIDMYYKKSNKQLMAAGPSSVAAHGFLSMIILTFWNGLYASALSMFAGFWRQ